MRRTKEDAAATRERVLDAALRVFSRKGYTATTLADVAADAALTRGAVYWHFKGKAELYTALIQERTAPLGAVFTEALSPDGRCAPLASLGRLLIRSIESLEEDHTCRAAMEINLFKTEVTPELEAGFRRKVAGVHELVDAVADLVRAGIQAGEIDRSIDAKAAAVAAMGLLNGLTAMFLMDPKLVGSKAAVRRAIEIYLRGLRA